MEFHPTITFYIGSFPVSIEISTILMSVLTALVVFIIARLAATRMSVRTPGGLQNMMEWVIGFVRGLARDMMDEQTAEKYVPLAFTLITYMFVANMLGLIDMAVFTSSRPMPGIGLTGSAIQQFGGELNWFYSPTATISVAMAMAIGVNLYAHGLGLKRPGAYFKHWISPNPVMLPLTIIEELSKFITLGLRLFGNIFAGEVLIAILLKIPFIFGWLPVGTIPLIVWLAYSMFVSTIQAFVFTVLTLVYISQKVSVDHH